MGRDKALLRFRDNTLVERAVATLHELPLPVSIVGLRQDLAAYGSIVADLRTGCGPLSGIEAALTACPTPFALIVAVDMPLMTALLLRLLLYRALLTRALVTIPYVLGRPQPLCAVYHRELLPLLSDCLDRGEYKIMRVVLDAARRLAGNQGVHCFHMEVIGTAAASDLKMPYPMHRAFMNCNTPSELAIAERVLYA